MSTTVVPKRKKLSATVKIPPEIFEEILCSLPVKSVGRFKCLSKSWKALISTPRFITAHLSHSRRHSRVAGSYQKDSHGLPERTIPFSFSFDISSLTSGSTAAVEITPLPLLPYNLWEECISCCCNGLFLATVSRESVYLMNPATQQFVEILLPPLEDKYFEHGLGYHSLTDDYWVVLREEIPNMVIHVYSLRKNSWRKIRRPSNNLVQGFKRGGVYLNGRLHWVCFSHSEQRSFIISFNTENGQFEEEQVELPTPFYPEFKLLNHELVALNGCLCLIDQECVVGCDAWVMKEYGMRDSWRKISVDWDLSYDVEPPCSKGDREMILKEPIDLCVYKVVERKKIHKKVPETKCTRLRIWGCYIESLVSPWCSNGLVGGSEG